MNPISPDKERESVPAVMDSMATVCGRSWCGCGTSFFGYKGVLKRVLMRVDLPRPDSPVCQWGGQYTFGRGRVRRADGPTTMAVKWKPGNEKKRVSGGTRGGAHKCVY